MKLSHLLALFEMDSALKFDLNVSGLQNDSRRVLPGDVFLAYPGALTDGRQYIQQAIDAGAVAVIYEPLHAELSTRVIPSIPMQNLATQLAALACRFYDNPARQLSITGVTGTNGKTTIAFQLAQAYDLLGHPSAYVGTIGQGPVHSLKPLNNTTPDALCLQRLLHEYQALGIQHVFMEVSSHALSLGRVDGIPFKQAIFTNLSHDHLDFHGSMAVYASAKALLFSKDDLRFAIINQDDPAASQMKSRLPSTCRLLTYGLEQSADVWAKTWDTGLNGSHLEVHSPWGVHALQVRALGRFNLYNTLAVFTHLLASELAGIEAIVSVMDELKPSPGRMEIVGQSPCVIVDYAHTPDALENVLQTLVDLKPGKLWVIFGCGGDRDRSKRPIMGQIASQYADTVVLTNDNPRREDPNQIFKDILKGIPNPDQIILIPDRRLAIETVLQQAAPCDCVLIAGKGHENYQIMGQETHYFSDQAVVNDVVMRSR